MLPRFDKLSLALNPRAVECTVLKLRLPNIVIARIGESMKRKIREWMAAKKMRPEVEHAAK